MFEEPRTRDKRVLIVDADQRRWDRLARIAYRWYPDLVDAMTLTGYEPDADWGAFEIGFLAPGAGYKTIRDFPPKSLPKILIIHETQPSTAHHTFVLLGTLFPDAQLYKIPYPKINLETIDLL